jgi:dynein heavy chain 1
MLRAFVCGIEGLLPPAWKLYAVRRHLPIAAWVSDLGTRLEHLQHLAIDPAAMSTVNIGLLFQPEAYITATQQAVAQRNRWSLEQLQMSFGPVTSGDADAFVLEGELASVGHALVHTLEADQKRQMS